MVTRHSREVLSWPCRPLPQRLAESVIWWENLHEEASGLAALDETVEATRRFLAQPGLIELFILATAEAADTSKPAHAELAARYEAAVQAMVRRLRGGVERGQDPFGR